MTIPSTGLPVCFADLDDTLFGTIEKIPEGQSPSRQATEAGNGRHSWMTSGQEAMFTWLSGSTDMIPVTARSEDAFSRVLLPFTSGSVLSNGALILQPDGTPDVAWSERISGISEEQAPFLRRMNAFIGHIFPNGELRSWIVDARGVDAYFCVKVNKVIGRDEKFLDTVLDELRNAFFLDQHLIHRNGNNLSISPPGISKLEAVDYLLKSREDLAGRPTIGIGDSITDLPFMRLCDMVMAPRASQISEKMNNLWKWSATPILSQDAKRQPGNASPAQSGSEI